MSGDSRAKCLQAAKAWGMDWWEPSNCCSSCHEDAELYGNDYPLACIDHPDEPGSWTNILECCCFFSEELNREIAWPSEDNPVILRFTQTMKAEQ